MVYMTVESMKELKVFYKAVYYIEHCADEKVDVRIVSLVAMLVAMLVG